MNTCAEVCVHWWYWECSWPLQAMTFIIALPMVVFLMVIAMRLGVDLYDRWFD